MQARILDGEELVTTTDPGEIAAALAASRRVWIDLERQTPEAERLLTEVLRLHPLTIEDIWAERLQPKIDDFDDYLYVIVHGIGGAKHDRLATVEIDLVIGPNWLVTHDPAGLVSEEVGTELDHSTRIMAKRGSRGWPTRSSIARSIATCR